MRKVTVLKKMVLISAIAILLGFSLQAYSQCENAIAFGNATVNDDGTLTTISTCIFTNDYSTVNGILNGETYEFAIFQTGPVHKYVTLRDAASGGAVLAHGSSPLSWVATYSGTVYAHWSDDAACNSTSLCHTGTVQWTSWTPPACPAPTMLTATNLTLNSADLGWTPGGDEELWNIEWGLAGFTQGTGTLIEGVTDIPYTLSGLDPATTYEFYVQADCGNGTKEVSEWAGPLSFTTLCEAVSEFSENFDAVTTPALPICWAKVGTTGSASTQTSNNFSPPNCLYMYSSGATSIAVVSMPQVTNLSDGTHWLRFMARANFTAGAIIEIGYLTDPADPTSFVLLDSKTLSLQYEEYTVSPVVTSKTSNTLAFRASPTPPNSLLIDDVIWEQAPDCLPPFNLYAENFTATSADLGWTPGGDEELWNIEYGLAGFTQGDGTLVEGVTDIPYTLSGLDPATTYEFYVQADCGNGTKELSAWAGPMAFTTLCEAFTVFPYEQGFEDDFPPLCWTVVNGVAGSYWQQTTVSKNSGTYSARSYNGVSSGYFADEWMILPAIDLDTEADYWMKFFGYSSQAPNGDKEKMRIMLLDEVYDNVTDLHANATELAVFYFTQTWEEYTVDLSSYSGIKYIAFNYYITENVGFNWIYVDDVLVEVKPDCVAPFDLVANNITATSADLGWTPGGELEWEVAVLPEGSPLPTEGTLVNTTTYTATNLTFGQSYDAYVRAVCGTEEFSEWASITFSLNYCFAGPTSTFDSDLFRVQLIGPGADFDHDVGCTGITGSQDFTALGPIELQQGVEYSMTITLGTCGVSYGNFGRAWIDFDQNITFDHPDELLGTVQGLGTSAGNALQFSFMVPPDATLGETRLRVMQFETTNPNLVLPCASFSWGSVHDYAIEIVERPPLGTIAGIVTDPESVPLEGVQVTAGGETVFTNINGEYELELNAGIYDFQFEILGYTTLTENFEVLPFTVNELNIMLVYAPQPACPTLVFPIAAIGIVPDAVLEWAASPDATGYKILLYDVTGDEWIEGDPDTFEGTDIGNTTTYVPAENFKFGHVYSWMITPYNFSGGPELCAPWSFQVAFGGDITGVVTDSESGLPIEGATVLIEQTLPNNLVTTVVTDENGEYDFEWETGNYKMTFSKYGYADQVFNNVTINLNQTTVRNAALTPFVPYEIPFFEGWDEGTFADQQWSTVPLTGYWQVFGGAGNPAPTARFISGPPTLNDYAFNLQSFFINGVGADQVFAQFDLLLSSSSPANTVESLSFMIFDGVEWHVIETFDNMAGSIPWTSFTYDISAYAAGGLFQIGFKAFGENSASIHHWYLDNIYISNKLMDVKPAALFEALNTDEQSTQHLQIFNYGILPLSWEAELYTEPLPNEWTVYVFGTGFADEVTWELRDNTGSVILSGGPYFNDPYNDLQTISTANEPLTFYIEAIGDYNDNMPSYTVSCGGEVIVQGQLAGGTEATHTGLACGSAGDSWLEMPVMSGIISGLGNSEIDVNFDALGLPPGTYTVEIIISGANGVIEQVIPVTLEVFDDAFQKIMIPAANSWGYISTYIDLTSKMPLETALADIVEEMIIMLGTDGIFWPGQNINTLGNWDTYKGYKLKMGEEGLLVFFGDPVEDKTVSFPAGTHFIPVLSEFPISALDVFGDHDIEFAFGLDGSIYWPFGGIYTLNTLYPGYGYLVKFNAPATLDFNVTKSTTLPNVVAEVENSTPWNDVTKTGDIHILGISGEALEMMQPGDIVGVFNDDGLCTGMSMYAEQNQPFAITVYGNDVTTAMRDGMEAGEKMHVMVFSNGEVTELDPVYSTRLAASDGNFANSGVSMITGVKSATGIDVEQANTLRIYPNPSDGLFTIQGADASMKVMVMNSHGQVVYQSDRLLSDKLDLSAQPAGIYFIRLIGNDQIRTEKVIIQ